jgi:uncharacterized protein
LVTAFRADKTAELGHIKRVCQSAPVVVVIDEFPFLVKASPSLPSIIQRELGPGGSGQGSAFRLLLCGSAMSVMEQVLAGHAPLCGRASLEQLVQPFGDRGRRASGT